MPCVQILEAAVFPERSMGHRRPNHIGAATMFMAALARIGTFSAYGLFFGFAATSMFTQTWYLVFVNLYWHLTDHLVSTLSLLLPIDFSQVIIYCILGPGCRRTNHRSITVHLWPPCRHSQLSRCFRSVPAHVICPTHWQVCGCHSCLHTSCCISCQRQETRRECHRHSAPCFRRLCLSLPAPLALPDKPSLLSARQPSNTWRQLLQSLGLDSLSWEIPPFQLFLVWHVFGLLALPMCPKVFAASLLYSL